MKFFIPMCFKSIIVLLFEMKIFEVRSTACSFKSVQISRVSQVKQRRPENQWLTPNSKFEKFLFK